ncbi:uncharacterized protein BXIN_2416 [Babesia sp. Xinjiang]|uniref:uncharacterized protein n=1 Tax=Babesia sp. Xinjiang TaxID=462227 RepID=UPI000A235C60|nr:uncharacterized protein BXIN_2416 [Babesia sp. Xinjiang]ORM40738.1 hypothetical protein BXIN_2416 [Babesia sp. Xinjiang]
MKAVASTRLCAGDATQSPTTRMTEQAWDEKWHTMVHHQKLRKEQDALLRQKLIEKREMEEYIECTFTPKTHCGYKSRSAEEVLNILKPLISEEERILQELGKIDNEEEESVRRLSCELRAHIAATQGTESTELIRLCEEYREERLKELARVKNKKLDIVGLLHEVERKYNIICVKERLTEDEMQRAGFNIDSCRQIKKEILESIKGVDTLKDRSKVTAEIDAIIKKAKEDAERQRLQALNNRMMPRGFRPVMYPGPQGMMPFAKQVPQMMMHPRGPHQGPPMVHGMVHPTMMSYPPQSRQPTATTKPQFQIMQTQGLQVPRMVHPNIAPVNPQFGQAQPMQTVRPIMLQRNVARKLRQ